MRTIVVLDSWAGQLHRDYTLAFPNVLFKSYQDPSLVTEPAHPHGGWVASQICQQVPFDMAVEVVFVRIFDRDGRWILDDQQWKSTMLAMWGYDADYICCSWGMADGDSPLGELMQEKQFNSDWKDIWVQSIGGADVFWAAGNSDNNDEDPDVDAPQKYFMDITGSHVIGSDKFNGVPSVFSGDGMPVDCMYPGEDTFSLDPLTGTWVQWSGTSAAAPAALGDVVANNLGKGEMVKDYWSSQATRARDYQFTQERHPKAGRGSMNHAFHRNILHTGRWPGLGTRMSWFFRPTIKSWLR
jgi:hypothetical protein